jgi:serine protease Do
MILARVLLVLALLSGPLLSSAQAEDVLSRDDAIYADSRPKLLQIRTLLAAAGQKSSTGSGFLVSADGLAITNYHVVSDYALEPDTYRLEYTAVDGGTGPVQVVALDLADDLALIRIDRRDQPFFRFDDAAVAGTMPKGERLYSMGNPLDLGFTIVDGTYNGLVDRSYNDRIHFSGAINPGMSGGPTVTADNRIAGINVAKQLGSDLVSFLVPARFAAALVARSPEGAAPDPKSLKAEIGKQLGAWQASFYAAIGKAGFSTAATGPYLAPESGAPWFTCWAQTNADRVPKPRAAIDSTSCYTDSRLFVAEGLNTGLIQLAHTYLRATDLNAMQFSTLLTQQSHGGFVGQWPRKWVTRQSCRDDYIAPAKATDGPVQRIIWCSRAYRDFDDLFDVSVTLVTEDRDREALVSRLALDGVSFENATDLSRHFVEAVRWSR